MDGLDDLRATYLDRIAGAGDEAALEEVRVAGLGKKGEVSLKMRELGGMTPEERQTAGPALNALKDELTSAIAARRAALADAALEARLKEEWLDVTLSPRPAAQGTVHPISQVTDEITAIFADLGYAVAEGPQIETDWYNFDALNIAPEHPARQEMDTFYMHRQDGDNRPPNVLRTHTSPVQIRSMEVRWRAPIRIISPGPRFSLVMTTRPHTPRCSTRSRGSGWIDRGVSMAHLKWACSTSFMQRPLRGGQARELRFRRLASSPLLKPRRGGGCAVLSSATWAGLPKVGARQTGWMEILGSGMVHPKVLSAAGVDPEQWQALPSVSA